MLLLVHLVGPEVGSNSAVPLPAGGAIDCVVRGEGEVPAPLVLDAARGGDLVGRARCTVERGMRRSPRRPIHKLP